MSMIKAEFDGWSCKLTGIGFEGPLCDKAMEEYENALGGTKERENTPDYHKIPVKARQRDRARA